MRDEKIKVILEMSLKPFKNRERPEIRKVCEEVFNQWSSLLKLGKEHSILFWIGSGEEIFNYKGNLDDEFEWAHYIGHCNQDHKAYIEKNTHLISAHNYMENWPHFTYRDLSYIIRAFKEIADEKYGIKLTMGATVDPGPEFCEEEFVYHRHPEILSKTYGGNARFICSFAHLKKDDYPYAAYPEGIPEGESFGRFLGKQCALFLSAMGFDYIWFSNGLGFSHYPWTILGDNFDGKEFNKVNLENFSEKLISFWKEFKKGCSYPVLARATNFPVGIDLSAKCTSLLEIYQENVLKMAPVNPPTIFFYNSLGLEMISYMGRLADFPLLLPFRYYINDPWFPQTPWKDYPYAREPFDIYVPLSIAVVDNKGKTRVPTVMNLLTIDDEKGTLREDVSVEVIPHLKRAIEDRPDEVGILTWLFPFHEYHQLVKSHREKMGYPFFWDFYLSLSIDKGLPLNTVISTTNFQKLDKEALEKLKKKTILITPLPLSGAKYEEKLAQFIQEGGKVIFYGPIDITSSFFKEMLNLKLEKEGLEGEISLNSYLNSDEFIDMPNSTLLKHRSHLSGGPLREVLLNQEDEYTFVRAWAEGKNKKRVFALTREMSGWNGGKIAWVRGSLPLEIEGSLEGQVSLLDREGEYVHTTSFLKYILADFSYEIKEKKYFSLSSAPLFYDVHSVPALTQIFISRKVNAFIFSGYRPDTSSLIQLKFPQGAPILLGEEVLIENGYALYNLSRSFHKECRIFVKQNKGKILCQLAHPGYEGKENLIVSGLKEAELRIYPPWGEVEKTDVIPLGEGKLSKVKKKENYLYLERVSGSLRISWRKEKLCKE